MARNLRRGYTKSYSGNYNRSNRKRKNGCKFGFNKNDDPYISGFKVIRGELASFYCSRNPRVGVEVVETKAGKEYEKWLCSVEFKKSYREDQLYTGFFDPQTKKCFIPDMNIMLDPNARVSSGRGGIWFMNN
ncbi:MAG: hypothetical protein ACOCRX_05615 [Candidatus Woesearchaeota archaeon]